MARRIRIGIDTGGTFTDVVAFDEDSGELVTAAWVLGVPHPVTGHTVKAFVVRSPAGGALTVDDLLAHAEKNLARFKCPTAVEFVAELPHSATGKVRKAALR